MQLCTCAAAKRVLVRNIISSSGDICIHPCPCVSYTVGVSAKDWNIGVVCINYIIKMYFSHDLSAKIDSMLN